MKGWERGPWGNFAAKAASLAVVVALLVGFSGWAAQVNAADAEVKAQIVAAERAANRGPFDRADGTYRGSAKGYGGDVVVDVTVENGYIDKIEAVSHKNEDAAWWSLAVKLLDTIADKQTTDVDVISTATYSSAGIINATRAALKSAPEAEG